jgi:hypothetical protein
VPVQAAGFITTRHTALWVVRAASALNQGIGHHRDANIVKWNAHDLFYLADHQIAIQVWEQFTPA